MAHDSKKSKEANTSTNVAKNNPQSLSKTITRSCSKEIVLEQQPIGAQPVKVNRKAGSHSKEIEVEQQSIGAKPAKMKAGRRSKEIVVEQQSNGAKLVKNNTKAGSHSKEADHQCGKSVKPSKASTPKRKSLAPGTSTVSKRPKTVPVEKEIGKKKSNQKSHHDIEVLSEENDILKKKCDEKDEKLKEKDEKLKEKDEQLKLMEQSAKNMRTQNSSLKNQVLVLEEWNEAVRKRPLTFAEDINLEQLMKVEINTKLIEAELIRRKIPRDNDIWLKLKFMEKSEEEKQKMKEDFSKKMKEKQLLQEQIAACDIDIEALNQKSQHDAEVFSKEIDILKKNLNELNTQMIDTEFTFAEKLEEAQKKCDDLIIPLQEQEAALTIATENNNAMINEYNRLLRFRQDNPPPPCEICVKQKEDWITWKGKYRESELNLRKMEHKFKKTTEDKWEAAKLKEGLEAEIELLKQKIHGTKVLNMIGNPSFQRMGEGILYHAKENYEKKLAYLSYRHSEKYEH